MHARTNTLVLIAVSAALASSLSFAQATGQSQVTPAPVGDTAAAVTPPAAQAPTDAPLAANAAPQRKPWSAIDTDGDGKISAVEAQSDAALLKHFPAMDADKDGFVTVAEYKAHISAKPGKKAASQG